MLFVKKSAEKCVWNLIDASFFPCGIIGSQINKTIRKLFCSINFQRHVLVLSVVTGPLHNRAQSLLPAGDHWEAHGHCSGFEFSFKISCGCFPCVELNEDSSMR